MPSTATKPAQPSGYDVVYLAHPNIRHGRSRVRRVIDADSFGVLARAPQGDEDSLSSTGGNDYLLLGHWPSADRWAAPDRIPDDCYFVLANDPGAIDSQKFGLVPGSRDGPCASQRYPLAGITMRVINTWPIGIAYDRFLAHERAVR